MRILDDFFGIAIDFLGISGDLLAETMSLLLLAANQLAYLFLHFTGYVFCHPFDLIFVHGQTTLSKLIGAINKRSQQEMTLPQGTNIELNAVAGLYAG